MTQHRATEYFQTKIAGPVAANELVPMNTFGGKVDDYLSADPERPDTSADMARAIGEDPSFAVAHPRTHNILHNVGGMGLGAGIGAGIGALTRTPGAVPLGAMAGGMIGGLAGHIRGIGKRREGMQAVNEAWDARNDAGDIDAMHPVGDQFVQVRPLAGEAKAASLKLPEYCIAI